MPPSAQLLDVTNLCIDAYAGNSTHRVVQELNFTLNSGKTLSIVGESGSGKSMTANAVMGLLPENVQWGGEITCLGEELSRITPRQARRLRGKQIGFIFQEPMTALHPTMTIAQQMVRPMRLHLGLSKREALEKAAELLDLVGIPASKRVLHSYVHQLSGGMRQRIMIAMAISCEPRLLIADEPTTALDTTIQKQIMDLIKEIQTQRGLGLMLISHDLGLVRQYTDDVVVMLDGQVMEFGRAEEVIQNPSSAYTAGLLAAAPKLGQKLDRLPTFDKSQFLNDLEGATQ